MSGKGSRRRPTDEAAYAEAWDRIFGEQEDGVQRVCEAQEVDSGQGGAGVEARDG